MLLLKHAHILLLTGGRWQALENGYLGIDGSAIRYIGRQRPAESYDEEKDMTGHLLMPGLYNLHTHAAMVLLRGVGSGLPLDRWLHEAMFPVEAKLTEEDISAGTRLAMMEMLACGVVSFSDMYDMPHITAEAVLAAGMKANLNRPLLVFDEAEAYADSWRAQKAADFHRDYHGAGDGRVLVDYAIHAEYTSFAEQVRRHGEACKAAGARMHLHLSETVKEHEACKARNGKTPARWFCDLGVFDSPTIAAHCVAVEPEDVDILREKGVTCVHNPSSNMKLGSGFMPLPALREAGINLALGTDGAASNNNLNLFEEMHLAAVLHNGYTGDPTAVSSNELLSMATVNGARGQGRLNCGELAVGNKADIIALNMDAPHLTPALDIPALLTYAAQGSDVAMTMVDGKILYEKGEFLTIDYERTKHDVRRSIERLYS